MLLPDDKKIYASQQMPEVRDEDFELLEAAASLPDALYGSRLYSNTAIYALATQRELYEAKIAELEAKLSLLASSIVENREREIAIRPLRRDAKGVVATVFALVFAICFLIALNLRQREDNKPSDLAHAGAVAQTSKYAQSTKAKPTGEMQSASETLSNPDTKASPIINSRDATTHLANAGHIRTLSNRDRLNQSLATQPPTETTPQDARQPEQFAFSDTASQGAAVEQAQDPQDGLSHSEPIRPSNSAPETVRRFRAIDALHALRMR